jgi:hypothetical protein
MLAKKPKQSKKLHTPHKFKIRTTKIKERQISSFGMVGFSQEETPLASQTKSKLNILFILNTLTENLSSDAQTHAADGQTPY